MRAIINGTRYDTETATKLGEYCMGKEGGASPWLMQRLYASPRSGNLFLHVSGPGMEPQFAGERIVPMGRAEALQWAGNRKITLDLPKEA